MHIYVLYVATRTSLLRRHLPLLSRRHKNDGRFKKPKTRCRHDARCKCRYDVRHTTYSVIPPSFVSAFLARSVQNCLDVSVIANQSSQVALIHLPSSICNLPSSLSTPLTSELPVSGRKVKDPSHLKKKLKNSVSTDPFFLTRARRFGESFSVCSVICLYPVRRTV